MSEEKRNTQTKPNFDDVQDNIVNRRIPRPTKPVKDKDDVEFKVTSSPTIGALEKQLNELAPQEFFPRKILITSKDQFVTVFAKVTEQEAPSSEELNDLLGTEGVLAEGAIREASNA